MSAPRRSHKPVVHLFVGLHKTGSSAIRLMLDFHGSMLDRHGFHLPRAGWTRYINGFWNGGHNNVPWEICGHHPVLPQFGTLQDLVTDIASLPDRQHIVFTEDLDYANGAQVSRLAEALASFDVRVIVFLRNQPAWLQSLYTEEHKWYTPKAAADWFLDRVTHDRRLHLDALCIRWAKAFEHRITVRCYETIRHRVFDAFLECCGAPVAMREELGARSLPAVNASPDADTLALISRLSGEAEQRGVRPEYFNAVISPAVVTAGAAVPGTKRREPMSAASREQLLALMSRVNTAVAQAFHLALGDEYFTVPPDEEPRAVSTEQESSRLMEAFMAMSLRLGTQFRLTDPIGSGSTTMALADSLVPWPLQEEPAAHGRLEALLAEVFASDDDAALYCERVDDRGVAFEQRGGRLRALGDFTKDQWTGLVDAVHRRARLNRASWNDLREGEMRIDTRRGVTRAWVRYVPTATGDVAMIEPVGRWGR